MVSSHSRVGGGGRRHLHHELRAVGDEQREQRRDGGRLACAHDELRDERLALGQRADELLDQPHLRLAQDDARGELEDQVARVVAQPTRRQVLELRAGPHCGRRCRQGRHGAAAVARVGLAHVVSLDGERGGERGRLERNLLFDLTQLALAHTHRS